MEKRIKVFESFDEQENYFLEYFFSLSPLDRLRALSTLQKKNNNNFLQSSPRKITIKKHFVYGY